MGTASGSASIVSKFATSLSLLLAPMPELDCKSQVSETK